MAESTSAAPRLGAWARSSGFIGLVADIGDDGSVTLFNPGEREMVTVPAEALERVPSAAVTVVATVDLPLAHGVDEQALRRWVASLLDEHLRERALSALAQEGIDEGAALPTVRVDLQPPEFEAAVCLCGTKVPAPEGAALPCPSCGRQAVGPPSPGGGLEGDGRGPA